MNHALYSTIVVFVSTQRDSSPDSACQESGSMRGPAEPRVPRFPRINGEDEYVFRVVRRSRSGRIADTTRRTSRDHALFRFLDGTMSRMSMRRNAQEMRLPRPLAQRPRPLSIRMTTSQRCYLTISCRRPITPNAGCHDTHPRPLNRFSRGRSRQLARFGLIDRRAEISCSMRRCRRTDARKS
jgi:hypothetical protein